jgi:perosamine synthetase
MTRVPVAGPSITEKEVDYVSEAVRSAWYEDANVYNERFEKAFAAHCGRRHAVSLPSCTSALHLALAALEVGPGDEVIVPDVTWIATVAPVCYAGATPVFVDIDARTWCISPDAFAAAITPRTKAAIAVDLYGSMPDWDALSDIAAANGVALIEDAAEAIGSRWKGRPSGAFGAMAAFSFHGSKTVTTGEGGMLVVDDDRLLARILQLRDHGRPPGDHGFYNAEVGFKYKMSSVQAALGLAQLERLGELVAAKRQIFFWYRQAFADWHLGHLNPDVPGLFSSCWMTTLVLDAANGVTKEELMPRLAADGISVRPFFYPLSSIPAFRDTAEAALACERNTVAYAISPYGINLPSALNLTAADVQRVADRVRAAAADVQGSTRQAV